MIKVLLADDHELVRTGIEVLLNACEDITVVGIAKSGEETIEKVSALLVDVVLVDIDMLGSGAIEVCSQILQHSTQAKIIVVSANNDSLIPPVSYTHLRAHET
jgi:two-component system invasion response regulator UvrY